MQDYAPIPGVFYRGEEIMVCVRCKKRTAVVFIQRMDNGKPVQEGYA